MEVTKIINAENKQIFRRKNQENKQILLGMRRIAECMWRIQEKFPIRTKETRTKKGLRDNAHGPKNAGFQDNTGLFPFVLS